MAIACPKPRVEQRREPRYRLPRRTVCRLKRAIEANPWRATLRNISADGIGLIVDHPVKAGMLLTVELPGQNAKAGVVKMIKVTHAACQPGGRWWLAGGRFANRLSDADLANLL